MSEASDLESELSTIVSRTRPFHVSVVLVEGYDDLVPELSLDAERATAGGNCHSSP